MYGNEPYRKPYRVQDDGRGFLHIVVFDGKRKKVALKDVDIWFFDIGDQFLLSARQ